MFFLNKEGKYVENVSVLHKWMDRTAVTGARSRYFIWYFVFFIVEKSGNFQGTMLMMIHEVIGWIAIYPSQMIYPCEHLNCLGINPPLTLVTCSNSCSADSSLSVHLKDVLTDEFSDINGRFPTRGQTNRLRRTNRLIFSRLERRFFQDDLPVETDKSTTVRHKFTSDGQMPDDLSVKTIYLSSSVKTAIPDLDFNNLSFSVRRSTRFVLNR